MFILWFPTAIKYEGGTGPGDRQKYRTRKEAEKAAKSNPVFKDGYLILPFKKPPKTYCEECDEYRCICKELEETRRDCETYGD